MPLHLKTDHDEIRHFNNLETLEDLRDLIRTIWLVSQISTDMVYNLYYI